MVKLANYFSTLAGTSTISDITRICNIFDKNFLFGIDFCEPEQIWWEWKTYTIWDL